MSICRIIPGESDVYLYEHVDNYVHCCMCRLEDDGKDGCEADGRFYDDASAVAHLKAHEAAGHRVPAYAFEYFNLPPEKRQ